MGDIIKFEGGGGSKGGGGPTESMLEQRVSRLETDMQEVKATLRDIQNKLVAMKVTLARIDGRTSQAPTWIQLIIAVIATWGAGAAIVVGLVRILTP